MVAEGINSEREELVNGARPGTKEAQNELGGIGDVGANIALPKLNQPSRLKRWAPDVRMALIEFELMARIQFECPDGYEGTAVLRGQSSASEEKAGEAPTSAEKGIEGNARETKTWQPIVTMSRPPVKFFRTQLQLVESHAGQREEREAEILSQVDPPMGYFASLTNLHSSRTPWTLELLEVAQQFAFLVGMRFKHALAVPRPIEYSSVIQPMIETPGHGSFPSGHGTESYMTVGVLSALVPRFDKGAPLTHLRRLAHRIAENRVIAGLHFPADNMAGQLLGEALSTYFVALAKGTKWAHASLDGDLLKDPLIEPGQDDSVANIGWSTWTLDAGSAAKALLLEQLWEKAAEEWR
jgi:membrane-associated phospholipid phosphatase